MESIRTPEVLYDDMHASPLPPQSSTEKQKMKKEIEDLKATVTDLANQNMTLRSQVSLFQSHILKSNNETAASPIHNSLLQNDISIIRDQLKYLDPSTSFIFFPLLPTELRLKIWRYYPSPRIFEIRGLDEYACGCICRLSTEKLPATFAVNHESRAESQKLYVRWEARDLWKLDVKNRRKDWYIYFNSQLDTLMLPEDVMEWWILPELCLKFYVKHLALHREDAVQLLDDYNDFYELWNVLDSITILEEINRCNIFITGSVLFLSLGGEPGLVDNMFAYGKTTWLPRLYLWLCIRAGVETEELSDGDEEWIDTFNPTNNDIAQFLRCDMIRLRSERGVLVPGPGAEIFVMSAYVTRIGNCFCWPLGIESEQEVNQWAKILLQQR